MAPHNPLVINQSITYSIAIHIALINQLNHLVMKQYTMTELYLELSQYSEFILKQLSSYGNDEVVSIAAKRVLLIKSL